MVHEGFELRRPHLEALARQGLLKNPLRTYADRLEFEIEMIKKMRFSSYFLIVWDLIKHARDNCIPVGPGRGSVVGSLVAYSLWITDIDPLQYDLFFERFLNPERIAPPDIDMDFCMNRRAEVIDYVATKYGRENVCQIITFGTMAAKGVIRDVGRTMDIPYAEVDRIAKLIPNELNATLDKALNQEPRLHEEMKNPQIATADRNRQTPGRPLPACVHPCRRCRDCPTAVDGTHSALQVEQGRNHDAVQHEGSGNHRLAQDGLPRRWPRSRCWTTR